MLIFNRYEYNPETDLLGEGGFSKVFRAFDTKLKRPVGLKIFSAGKGDGRYNITSEIERVIQLDHPNICRYYDTEEIVYTSPFGQKDTTQVAVLELLTGGDLKKYFQHGTSKGTHKKLLLDVLHGLAYLHKNHIIHRDIKPQNILIKETNDGPVAKIVDFGISKNTDSTQNKSSAILGSIEYMAPEQFNAATYGIKGRISTNVDLWAFGIMLYELLTDAPLFGSRDTGDTTEQLMHKILGEDIDDRILGIEEPYRNLVQQCLVKDANRRAQKAEDLITLLEYQHPVQAQNAEDLISLVEPETQILPKEIVTNTTQIIAAIERKERIRKPPLDRGSESDEDRESTAVVDVENNSTRTVFKLVIISIILVIILALLSR